jgi:cobaltochelatase CobS
MLIDEFDLGDPEIMPVIQPVLEGKGVRLLEDGGRYVKPHELCVIGATGNTNGLGSDNNVYLNAHEQSGATRDRIAMYIEMPYLPADKELEVVMARVPHADQAFAEKVIQLANKTRESYKLGDIGQLVSTRHVLDAIELHAHNAPLYGDEDEVVADTLECVVLNFCDANTRSVVRGYIDAIF